jgi:N-acetyl-anhydromuramyl-L-alanine amidase AmpD
VFSQDEEPKVSEVAIRKKRLWIIGGSACLLYFLVIGGIAWVNRKKALATAPLLLPSSTLKPTKKPYAPEGIVFHHSETPAKVGKTVIDAKRLEEINRHDHPNWESTYQGKTYFIGYHYVILPDGTVQPGRPELMVGTHARKYNNWLGICLIGAFHGKRKWSPSEPTEAQKEALIQLSAKLIHKYSIPLDHVKRHIDVNQTNCPGARFPYNEIMLGIRDALRLMPPPLTSP